MEAVAQTILLFELETNKTMKALLRLASALLMKMLLAPETNLLFISVVKSRGK